MGYRENCKRDCYQQAKTIHRLMLTLCDDLGDLSAGREDEEHQFYGKMADLACDLESKLMALRNDLEGR